MVVESGENVFSVAAMLKRITTFIGALLISLGLNSCLESDTTISVKKDGSGTLTENVFLGAQMMGLMQMGGGAEGEDPLAQFSEESLKEKAKVYGKGVEFVEVKKEKRDGGINYVMVYKFADIAEVKFTPGASLNPIEKIEEEGEKIFSFEDGELTIELPNPAEEEYDFGGEDVGEEQMAMMVPMMAGLRVNVSLVCEDEIESTNATYRDGNTITLMGMNFDELMTNEGGIEVMKKLKVETREEFAVAVKEVKGFQVEAEEKVSIKFK